VQILFAPPSPNGNTAQGLLLQVVGTMIRLIILIFMSALIMAR